MNSVPTTKLVAVGFARYESNLLPSREQRCGSYWLCSSDAQCQAEENYDFESHAINAAGSRAVMTDQDLDEAWERGFEKNLPQLLVAWGIVDILMGIVVYEVRLFGKNGALPGKPARYIVLQAGSAQALYVASTPTDAFAAAELLANSQAELITPAIARQIEIASHLSAKFRLR